MAEVDLHRRAIADAIAARRYLARLSRTLANRFMSELDDAIEMIGESPLLWSPYRHGTRAYFMKSFPYSVV